MEPKDQAAIKEGKKTLCLSSSEEKSPGNSIQKKEYSEKEEMLIANYIKRTEVSAPVLDPNVKREKGPELFKAKLTEASGSTDSEFQNRLLAQVVSTCFATDRSKPLDQSKALEQCNSILAVLYGIKPQDELEGMLVAQMLGTHNLGMMFLEKATNKDQSPEDINLNITWASKLLRLYTAQVEALSKYRNRGQQKVTVEHIHVNAGGQAVVGIVNPKPGGGDSENR